MTPNNPQVNHRDYLIIGQQCAMMIHQKPRRSLFRPFQGFGAPKLGTLTSTRVTHGTFIDNETAFLRQDNWTCKSSHDLDIGRSWTGRTIFMPKRSSTEIMNKAFEVTGLLAPITRHVQTRIDLHNGDSMLAPSVGPFPSGSGNRFGKASVRNQTSDAIVWMNAPQRWLEGCSIEVVHCQQHGSCSAETVTSSSVRPVPS